MQKKDFPPGCQHGCRQTPNADNQFAAQVDRLKEYFQIPLGRGSDEKLGKIIGVERQTINIWSKKGIPGKRVKEISKEHNLNANCILYGEGSMRREDPIIREVGGEYKVLPEIPEANGLIPESFILIPYVEAHLGAGDGAFLQSESQIELYAFRKDWLSGAASSWDNLILMPVRGPSMEKTIFDGDVVMIDTGRREIIRDLIYAVRIQETIAIKRLQRLPDSRIRLISDNTDYPPEEVLPNEIQVLGRIIWLARDQIK